MITGFSALIGIVTPLNCPPFFPLCFGFLFENVGNGTTMSHEFHRPISLLTTALPILLARKLPRAALQSCRQRHVTVLEGLIGQ